MKKLLILVFVLLFSGVLKAQEQQIVVPYTLADRDRTIRLEAKMDVKFESVNARIDYIFWLQGVIVALILFILGYMIWDRRTALQPALDKASDANEKSTTLIQTLREYARKHPDLAEILKTHGML